MFSRWEFVLDGRSKSCSWEAGVTSRLVPWMWLSRMSLWDIVDRMHWCALERRHLLIQYFLIVSRARLSIFLPVSCWPKGTGDWGHHPNHAGKSLNYPEKPNRTAAQKGPQENSNFSEIYLWRTLWRKLYTWTEKPIKNCTTTTFQRALQYILTPLHGLEFLHCNLSVAQRASTTC